MQGFENILILPGHGGSESLLHLKESLRILKWLNPDHDYATPAREFFPELDTLGGSTSARDYLTKMASGEDFA